VLRIGRKEGADSWKVRRRAGPAKCWCARVGIVREAVPPLWSSWIPLLRHLASGPCNRYVAHLVSAGQNASAIALLCVPYTDDPSDGDRDHLA